VLLRKRGLIKSDGLAPRFLLYHHGNRYSDNLITWYDEHYNGRGLTRNEEPRNRLPELRSFSSQELAWVPERTDYPILGTLLLRVF
jgi:hypothetical protein